MFISGKPALSGLFRGVFISLLYYGGGSLSAYGGKALPENYGIGQMALGLTNDSVKKKQGLADTLFRLNPVVVSSETFVKEAVPVQRLSGKELERLSSNSVADAIRYFSGVQIKDYGGIGGLKTINVRSIGTNHVGVFYDGIELGNAQNGIIDLGRYSLDNMAGVSVYNAQRSAELQPAKDFASSSSLYLTTRRPEFGAGQKDNLRASFKSGSFGLASPSFLWERKLTQNSSLSLNTEYLYTNGKYRFTYRKKDGYDTTSVRQNGDVATLRGEAGLYGSFRGGSWKLRSYLYISERGYPGASVREEPGIFKNQDRQWDTDLFIQGSLRKDFGPAAPARPRLSLLLNAKGSYNYLHFLSDPRLDVSTMYIDNRYHQRELYFSAAGLCRINENISASLSSDFQYNSLSANLYGFVYPERFQLLTAGAVWLTIKNLKMQGSLLGISVKDRSEVSSSVAKELTRFTPSLILSWNPSGNEQVTLRAFYKRMLRLPTFNDLYYTFIGNKDLKPESTTQYNLGVTINNNTPGWGFRELQFSADIYYNEVYDKIIAMPTSNQFRWTMVNLGIVRIKGADLTFRCGRDLPGEWRIGGSLNYTWQKAQDFTNPESTYYGGQIPYIPWNSGSLVLNGGNSNWDLYYSFIYTGERYESQANIPENYAQPWYTSDISASWNITSGKYTFKITAELNNLFGQQYEVVQSYPMPGRNFRLTLKVSM